MQNALNITFQTVFMAARLIVHEEIRQSLFIVQFILNDFRTVDIHQRLILKYLRYITSTLFLLSFLMTSGKASAMCPAPLRVTWPLWQGGGGIHSCAVFHRFNQISARPTTQTQPDPFDLPTVILRSAARLGLCTGNVFWIDDDGIRFWSTKLKEDVCCNRGGMNKLHKLARKRSQALTDKRFLSAGELPSQQSLPAE